MSMRNKPATSVRLRAEMDLLSAIERGEVLSQLSLTKRVGVSLGMVNALVKRAVSKGYAKMSQAPYKRFAYYLTPQGFAEKSRLVAAYLESSLAFFKKARAEYEAIFTAAPAQSGGRILAVGEGELLEIAYIAAVASGGKISGLLCAKSGVAAFGLPRIAVPARGDLLVVTDCAAPQDAYERARLAAEAVGAVVVAPPFLRVTPDRRALMAAVAARDVQEGAR